MNASSLASAPMVQAIKHYEQGQKVNKWRWDDYASSPSELVDAVWHGSPIFTRATSCPTACTASRYWHTTCASCVVRPAVVKLMAEADARFQLRQRERITLGLLAAAGDGLTARELATKLELVDSDELRAAWLGRLLDLGLVQCAGKTQAATRYFVAPALLKGSGLDGKTTLQRMPPHRLRALIVEDLSRYPGSSATQVHRRTGPELAPRTVKRSIDPLVAAGEVVHQGERRWRRYRLTPQGHTG